MPFTPAHAAAALPFRRTRLNTSALIAGTFAPDFEYFLRLSPSGGFGHTPLGAFVLSLPLALLVLWLFHTVVKVPLISLLPDAIQGRVTVDANRSRFANPATFTLIAGSALVGIMTHILWDSFTHPNTWPYRHWLFLRLAVHLPIGGSIPGYEILQHASTIIGTSILAIWFVLWYRTTEPRIQPAVSPIPHQQRLVIIAVMLIVALIGSLTRIIIAVKPSVPDTRTLEGLIGKAVCTFIALVWWQLVAYGLFFTKRASHP
jgi:hypothetical protein